MKPVYSKFYDDYIYKFLTHTVQMKLSEIRIGTEEAGWFLTHTVQMKRVN